MNWRSRGFRQLALMLLVLALAASTVSVFLPVSHAGWQEVLGIRGSIAGLLLPDPESSNCTYPLVYWTHHGDRLPPGSYPAGSESYDPPGAVALLSSDPGEDYSRILAQQVLLARVNIQNGADPQAAADSLARADALLVQYPFGSELLYEQQLEAYRLASALQAFNHGESGPGLCPNWHNDLPHGDRPTAAPLDDSRQPRLETSTPTATLLVIPTWTGTPTHTPTATLVPTNTPYPVRTVLAPPTATQTPLGIVQTLLAPTSTPQAAASRTPLPTPTPLAADCLQPVEYWASLLPQAWPAAELSLGDALLEPEEALQLLQSEPDGRVAYRLAQQYLAAQLNLASGALPLEISPVMEQAHLWFQRSDLRVEPDLIERKLALELAGDLEAYNRGTGGCPAEFAEPTARPSLTPTPTASATLPAPALTQVATRTVPTPSAPPADGSAQMPTPGATLPPKLGSTITPAPLPTGSQP